MSDFVCCLISCNAFLFKDIEDKISQTKKECAKLKKENDKLKTELKGLDLVCNYLYPKHVSNLFRTSVFPRICVILLILKIRNVFIQPNKT